MVMRSGGGQAFHLLFLRKCVKGTGGVTVFTQSKQRALGSLGSTLDEPHEIADMIVYDIHE